MVAMEEKRSYRLLDTLRWLPIAAAALLPTGCCTDGGDAAREAFELSPHFDGFDSCFVLLDLRTERRLYFNAPHCDDRYPPCSTFKIPHALIALQTGVLADETTTLTWDGTQQIVPAWERDHTLGSAVRASCVWYFQRVAGRIGAEEMQRQLHKIDYGNRDITGGVDKFWLMSSLRISPDEQVAFLARLYRDQLPFAPEVAETVKRILVVDKENGAVLSGKTGSGVSGEGQRLGWFVGHLKTVDREFVFATLIRGQRKDTWGPKARDISKAVLSHLGHWRLSTAADDGG